MPRRIINRRVSSTTVVASGAAARVESTSGVRDRAERRAAASKGQLFGATSNASGNIAALYGSPSHSCSINTDGPPSDALLRTAIRLQQIQLIQPRARLKH
ncbi:hypothetical protein DQ04_04781070 [Trypanosoma grayi]|uniref:hypothetical protein n=1 Tax=Trypanosoma grayi TaxID=71804 RepID=UPI0004F4226A|nr:hypothetical protein DQ04_04781070 [Trypanosoma grayi]KEG09715.1 hypothetical protein DQ04_04781070 [Trypanosoma grayi]